MPNYQLDRAGFEEHLLNAPWMVAEMRRRAEAAAEYARSIAPVDEDGPHPGRYRDSIGVDSGTHGTPGSAKQARAWAEVRATDPDSAHIEWGNGHDDGAHVMTRTLDALR
jgi:hypothetical protein